MATLILMQRLGPVRVQWHPHLRLVNTHTHTHTISHTHIHTHTHTHTYTHAPREQHGDHISPSRSLYRQSIQINMSHHSLYRQSIHTHTHSHTHAHTHTHNTPY